MKDTTSGPSGGFTSDTERRQLRPPPAADRREGKDIYSYFSLYFQATSWIQYFCDGVFKAVVFLRLPAGRFGALGIAEAIMTLTNCVSCGQCE